MVIPCKYPDDVPKVQTTPGAAQFSVSSDVQIIGGPPGHTWSIKASRELFRCPPGSLQKLVENNESTIYVTDADKSSFEQLIRHVEGSETTFTSVQTARSTLDLAYTFERSELAKLCIQFIAKYCDRSNVLSIFKGLRKYAYTSAPSAPPLDAAHTSRELEIIRKFCTQLLNYCLHYIDQHVAYVIQTPAFETLDFEDLELVVSRNTLQLESEMSLYNALERWRQNRVRLYPVLPTAKPQDFLKDLVYAVHYALMTKEEFLNGPAKSGIFDPNEINLVLSVINKEKNVDLPHNLRDIATLRVKSDLDISRSETGTNDNAKKDKKSHKVLLNCLSIFAAIFD